MKRLTLTVLLLSASHLAVPAATLSEIRVFPKTIHLSTRDDHQSVLIQARYDNGITEDITSQATFTLSNPALCSKEGNVLRPRKNGTTQLTITIKGQTKIIPITVKQATTKRPISFRLDVVPLLTKAGCNTGACHGSSRGKDMFRLSLFGYDPAGDYFRLTRDFSGRRINLAIPEKSMIIEKTTGAIQHSGGDLFTRESPQCKTLMQWLSAGAPDDAPDVATPTKLELFPKHTVLEGKTTQQLMVRASYSDGTDRDVTKLARFMSSDELAIKVSPHGLASAGVRGEAFVIARLATLTTGTPFITIPKNAPAATLGKSNNYIDTLISRKLAQLRITPSNLCSDEIFLRRATIDIIGSLPTPEEFKAFTSSPSPNKRADLVNALVERKGFIDLWVMKWAELLQIRSGQDFSYKSAILYHNWLEQQLSSNVPINTIIHALLSSNGGTFSTPPTNYYQVETETLKRAENVAQVFMGTRIQCAQCHNHPFDKWTMDDYYGFAAFFSQVGVKKAEDPRERIVFNKGNGDVKHLVDKRVMAPRFLGGDTPKLEKLDRRKVLADWLTSPDNPYFARNVVNIIWAQYMGRGIIEPVDDARLSNPPANPELLDALAKKLVESNYDFKTIVRDICNSRTYQLSTRTNPSNELDERNFSHATVRRLRAEVLLDCISTVTHTKDKFSGLPLGARATHIADGKTSTHFLTTFGRATRATVCSCEVSMEPNLSQALALINGKTVGGKISSGDVVKTLLKEGKSPTEIMDILFVQCLSRKPTEGERSALADQLVDDKGSADALNDIFWALLNSQEFIFNH